MIEKWLVSCLLLPGILCSWALPGFFDQFPNRHFVETGSYDGDGIKLALDAGFAEIHSIELGEQLYDACQKRFADRSNVHIWLGDSGALLSQVIEKIQEPITFWLDAHWSENKTVRGPVLTPILQELAAIRNHPIKTHTILIDDVRCFGTPNFEYIGLNEIIKAILDINPNYVITYQDGFVPRDILIAQVPSNYPLTPAYNTEYTNLCVKAATDPAVFRTFKRDPKYTAVLEHVNEQQGQSYLNHIVKYYPHLLRLFKKFQENDALGSPTMYDYPQFGKIGPTTLRYIKTLGDLELFFGNLDQMNIIEIGAGYGGQCLITSKAHHFATYKIVELPGPQLLIEQYLRSHGIANFQCLPFNAIPTQETYDLVISNYSFSECPRRVQEVYLEKILKNAKHGYLTLNLSTEGRYTSKELVYLLRSHGLNPQVFPEDPKTGPNNCILVW